MMCRYAVPSPFPGDGTFVGRVDVIVAQPPLAPAPDPLLWSLGDTEVVTVEVPMPDEVRETYLEVRAIASDCVITLLEILSSTNTCPSQYHAEAEALLQLDDVR